MNVVLCARCMHKLNDVQMWLFGVITMEDNDIVMQDIQKPTLTLSCDRDAMMWACPVLVVMVASSALLHSISK